MNLYTRLLGANNSGLNDKYINPLIPHQLNLFTEKRNLDKSIYQLKYLIDNPIHIISSSLDNQNHFKIFTINESNIYQCDLIRMKKIESFCNKMLFNIEPPKKISIDLSDFDFGSYDTLIELSKCTENDPVYLEKLPVKRLLELYRLSNYLGDQNIESLLFEIIQKGYQRFPEDFLSECLIHPNLTENFNKSLLKFLILNCHSYKYASKNTVYYIRYLIHEKGVYKNPIGLPLAAFLLLTSYTELTEDEKRSIFYCLETSLLTESGSELALALFMLSHCYKSAIGVAMNQEKSIELLKLAAKLGSPQAQHLLAEKYAYGIELQKDELRAFELFTIAADQNLPESQNNLGSCYEMGIGTPKNPAKAFEFYNLAAHQGHQFGQYNLGRCYENGIGVKKSQNSAFQLIEKAANAESLLPEDFENGLKEALSHLAQIYEKRKMIDPDHLPRTKNSSIQYYFSLLKASKIYRFLNLGEDLNRVEALMLNTLEEGSIQFYLDSNALTRLNNRISKQFRHALMCEIHANILTELIDGKYKFDIISFEIEKNIKFVYEQDRRNLIERTVVSWEQIFEKLENAKSLYTLLLETSPELSSERDIHRINTALNRVQLNMQNNPGRQFAIPRKRELENSGTQESQKKQKLN